MDSHNKKKLNFLLKNLPKDCIAVQPWLGKNNIYRQLVEVYRRSGWVQKIGHGAYIRAGDTLSWTGGLYAIQKQLGLPIHVGGSTALQRQGLAHFLPMGQEESIFLFGHPPAQLPAWFREYHWGVKIHYSTPQLFTPSIELGLTEENMGDYAITLSSPERAIMEMLYFVPKEESFENARYLMEGLTTLRSGLVQQLLEDCRSVKMTRLFLFLAEECGHNWRHELNINCVNRGKGKRVIVQGGRLDPVYGITVTNEPFVDPGRQMQDLLNKRKKSPAVRLMCPPQHTRLVYGKEQGYLGSILYLAFERGNLFILDQLLKEFKIEQRGSKKFKGSLRENWLGTVPIKSVRETRNNANRTASALIELVVAKHIKADGVKILDLEAWNNKAPDVSYRDENQQWNVEVKYIGQPPEWLKSVMDQLRARGSEPRSFGDGEFINYYFGRIAEAAKQLERYALSTRQVWLVFSVLANFERNVFEKNYLRNPPHWFRNTDEQNEILSMISKKSGIEISHSFPSTWLGTVSEIVLATCNEHWTLENITRYNTKDLII